MKVAVVKNILEANRRLAEENRRVFDERGLLVINLMSSPGAGKTTLLEKTIHLLKNEYKIGVVEGDIQSTYDAERIGKTGLRSCRSTPAAPATWTATWSGRR